MSVIVGQSNPKPSPEEIVAKVEKEDEAFASLSGDPRWDMVTNYMLERIAYYETALNEAVDTGATNALIGEKYSVHAKVKAEFVALINRVEISAREIQRERDDSTDL